MGCGSSTSANAGAPGSNPQTPAPAAAAAAAPAAAPPPAAAEKATAAPAPSTQIPVQAQAPPAEKDPTPAAVPAAAPVETPTEPESTVCKLRVIFVNDVYELDNWPRFLTAVDSLTEDKDNTIVLLPGDFVAPSLLSSLDHARGMIDCMNRCKFQYVCFGNHECDIPHQELINRIKESNFKWINTNMTDIDLGDIGKLPEYEEITVKGGGQTRKVGLIGLLTEDPALYRPGIFNGATITPVKDEAEKMQKKLCVEGGMDLVLPMTHQVISLDRKFMEYFKGKGVDNENAFPLVVAAHDHEPYQEEVAGSKVLKTGSDAKNVGVCDIIWPDPKSKRVEVTTKMIPIEEYAPNPIVQKCVDKHQSVLKELDSAPLFLCEGEQLSSKTNRIQQTSLGTKLVSSLRDALGADCCVLNAGNIRGNKVYDADKKYFTYNDLKTEIPFDAEMVTMPLPGKVISAAVKFTREKSFLDPPQSFGGFMQISDDMTFDNATQSVTHIAGQPIDPEKIYSCGILFMVMTGVDSITPLMEWAAEHADLLPIDGCSEMGRPAKLLLVDYFSKAIWYQMGAFNDIDTEGKGYISREDVFKAAAKHFGDEVAKIYVDNVMRAADMNKDGKITKDELMRVNMMNAWARRDMDLNKDGLLDRGEIEAFTRKILGDDYDQEVLNLIFKELDPDNKGHVDGKAVETWLGRNFSLETVSVPGQTLERGEIAAVKTRLLEKSNSQSADQLDLCRLRVIFVNDVYELDNWPRFLTAVNNLTEDKDNTIVLLPGDFVAPSLLSSLDHAKGMIDCMNQCKVQYVCFGNHECDIPHQELINRIKESNFKWINTNMTDIDLGDIGKLPEYEEITVKGGGQTRKVGLIGLLTEDPALYRPGIFNGATITPVKDEAEKMQKKLCVEGGMDLVLPMTHQVISLDKEFMEYFKGKGVDNENAFPMVIGAHDHEPYEIEVAGSKVLKTGSDAKNVGIVDIVWPDPKSKRVEVMMKLEPIENFGPNPMVQKTVEKHQSVLKELDSAPLFNCEGEQLSSKTNRIQQTSLGTKLVSSLRDALGADCCVLNAGNIRGNKVYDADKKYFTYNDLKTEIPFDAEMVTMPLPGHVIAGAVKFTREKSFLDPPQSFGGYMQISDDMTFDNETQTVTHIAGQPIDPEKIYSCGILFMVMTGVDSITPLMEWAAEHADLLPIDGCSEMGRPAKLLLVDYFSKAIWYQMGAFKDIDEGGKGYISREDVFKAAAKHFGDEVAKIYVDNVMRAADMNKDGKITKDELLRVNMMNAWARRDMDLNKDGLLDRGEIEAFTRKILGDDYDTEIVDRVFKELDKENKGSVDGRAVEQWLGRNFSLETVSVPGQTLERGEIAAVKTRLLERAGSKDEAEMDLCRLRVIFVNDVYELDNWPRFLTAVNNLTADKDNTIVLLPGDFVAPSLLSSLDHAKGMIDCMNQCKFQYVCFGNHECDIPHQELINRIKESNFKWINTNMTDIDLGGMKLPEYEEITVKGGGQTRKVGLIGLLTEDPALYRPGIFNGATITPVKDEAEKMQQKLCVEGGMDLVLPMTHQVISLDKEFMEYFKGKGVDNENAFPMVIGAHDHEPYEIEVAGSKVLKTGSDAKNVGIVDIVWPDPKSKRVEVSMKMEPIENFGPNPMVQRTVEKHQSVLKELDSAPLFNCEGEQLSSKTNRIQQTSLGTKLVSSLRDALGADCCVLNAGNIRGNKVYDADKKYFTYNDLKTEIPFDAEMVTMPLPGHVIAGAVKFTREKSFLDPPQSFGGYMQISDDMTFDNETQTVTHIGGKPIEPEKIYSCGILFMVMTGVDNITPLMDWAAKNSELFPTDACSEMGRPAKLLLVDYFSKAIWYQMGAFKDIDQDNKGYIGPEDVAKAASKHFGDEVAKIYVDNVMRAADVNKDGKITKDELMRVNLMNAWARRDMDLNKDGVLDKNEVETFAKKILGEDFDHTLVDTLFQQLDTEGKGHIDGRAVEQWLSRSFNLETVSVPGQTLERNEIKAVKTRLLERAGSKDEAEMDLCRLRVIFVNDVYELDNWPRFLTAVQNLTEDKDNTIVLLPGDFVAPSLLSSLDHAKGMIDCMNQCKVQYVCFGNHECDIPHQELINRIKESNFKWINTNMTDIDLGDIGKLPEYEEITVKGGGQTRKVGLIGLLTEDPALYRPGIFNGATITPVKDEAEKMQQKLCVEGGMDLVLPMTHQVIGLDKEFMEYFKGKGVDNENAFPMVIGAHDHEPYEIEVAGSKVLKTGSDAKNVGIVDIVWPDPKSKRVEVMMKLEPIENFGPNPMVQKTVEKHQSVLKELDSAPLFNCEGEQLSSKTNRIQQTSLGTKLVSSLRDALGADCCVLNAGNIRGNKVYDADKKYFTYNDLKTEIPFDAEMVTMPLPGHVIAGAVKFTREKSFLDPPQSFGGYMQISDDMTFDNATQSVTHIGGKPIEPEKIYSCGILFMVMTGVDNITPLMDWAAKNSNLLPLEACAEMGRPAKLLLVDYFSKAIWYQMGAFKDIDQDGKGHISPDDVSKAAEKHFGEPVAKIYVDNVMRAADVNKDGKITKDELMRVNLMNAWARRDMDLNKDGVLDKNEVETFAKKILGEDFDHTLVDTLFQQLDTEGKGHIDGRAVELWMSKDFRLETVSVPGQTLERGEIAAVKTRLLEKSNSQSADQLDLCRLRVIFVNDVYELDNWPRFLTAVNNLTEDKDNTIVLLPGDFLAPSLLSSLDQGKGMVDCMNQCKFQYVCFGNHECDIPHSELINRIKESNFKWINTNMPDLDLGDIKLPEYEEITVKGGGQTRKVGLIGLLTEDPALYRPDSFGGAKILPVTETAEKMQKKLCVEGGMDLVLPMTHQVITLDKAFLEYFKGKGVDNENAFPMVIGAHDHDPYEVKQDGAHLLKTGCDAKNVGIIDIVWPDPKSKRVEISMKMEPIENFGPNPIIQKCVEKHQSVLKELDFAPLFLCEGEPLTSKSNRVKQTNMGTKLVSSLRDALGCDCCVLNAGNIRGNKDYDAAKKYFTYNDLKTEMPFDAEMAVFPLPGKVIAEAVRFTRAQSFQDPPVAFGGYMQISDDMTFDDEKQALTHIANEPIDPERIYTVGVRFMVMAGLDNITSLMDWAAQNSHLFPVDVCHDLGRPAKLLLVDYFSKAIWYQMGAFKDIDQDGKGHISPDDVSKAAEKHFGEPVAKIYVDNVMRAADVNKDGKITKDELLRVNLMNAWARRDADLNKDGVLDKNEVETFAKKILGDDFDSALVDTIFAEVDKDSKGAVDGRAIEAWLSKNFSIHSVSVPGQPLDRTEIKALQDRLLEQASNKPANDICRLRVLFVNDVYELNNWPRFLTAVNKLTIDKDNTLVLLPGDFVAPSLLSSLDHAKGMIDCMNLAKVQYVCFGNHECDIPHDELINRIKESKFKWINTNMTDIDLGDIGKLPEYEEIVVKGGGQERKVGLIGLLTEDPALYRPGIFNGATITPVKDEAEKMQQKLCVEGGMDLVLPMTHQVISLDKEFMEYFKGKGVDNENAFPMVIGAHDHEPYEIELAGSKVLKTGCDAKAIGIVDIAWPDPKSKRVEVAMKLEPIENFDLDPELQKVVEKHQSVLKELDTAPLFNCEGEQLSSKTNRIQQTSLGTKLVSSLRDALGADCCVLNAGNIRGNKVYDADKKYFTYNDLKTEIPFDAEMVTMPLPGHVIAGAVKFTREKSFLDPPQSFGGYMQISDDMTFDNETQTVTHIGGKPIEPEKIYSCGILFMVMTGVDNITPLMDWAAKNSELFPTDACSEMGRPAKLLLVDYFSKAIWYQMGAFKDIDQDNKGYIGPEDVAKAASKHFGDEVAKIYVDNVMRAADVNKDGKITKDELMRVNLMNAWARRDMDLNKDGVLDKNEVETFAKKILGEDFDHTLVDTLFQQLDTEGKGHIDGRAVEQWLTRSFSLESVNVPGQTLERGEIKAVQERLKERASKDANQ